MNENQKRTKDIQIVGDGNMFQLLCKASSKEEGWMKSTKACEIPGVGCIVQVTTQQGENVAESLCTVADVTIIDDINGGRKLISSISENTRAANAAKGRRTILNGFS